MTWLPTGPDFTPKGLVDPPDGWLDLIDRHPELDSREIPPVKIEMTQKRAVELSWLNSRINKEIKYEREAPGKDVWRIKGASGDCEDYVGAKRVHLVNAGWPMSCLLYTLLMFWDTTKKKWQAHAVLTVATSNVGPYILDNRMTFWRVAAHIPNYYWLSQELPESEKWQKITLERELRK